MKSSITKLVPLLSDKSANLSRLSSNLLIQLYGHFHSEFIAAVLMLPIHLQLELRRHIGAKLPQFEVNRVSTTRQLIDADRFGTLKSGGEKRKTKSASCRCVRRRGRGDSITPCGSQNFPGIFSNESLPGHTRCRSTGKIQGGYFSGYHDPWEAQGRLE